MKKLIIGLALLSLNAVADVRQEVGSLPTNFNACKEYFPQQKPQRRAAANEVELCYDGFAILYNTAIKSNVYSVAMIDPADLRASQERNGNRDGMDFFVDPRLPLNASATDADYRHSGYDRGHIIGNAMATSPQFQEQTFVYTNMAPQLPVNNRKIWAKLENDFRKYARKAIKPVYLYAGVSGKQGMLNKVTIPAAYWMFIIPTDGTKPYAFWLDNSDTAVIGAPLTQQQLEKKVGFKF